MHCPARHQVYIHKILQMRADQKYAIFDQKVLSAKIVHDYILHTDNITLIVNSSSPLRHRLAG